MPMIVAGEVEYACPLDIESDIEIVARLIKKMAGISPLIAASPVISAAHVRAHADALLGP